MAKKGGSSAPAVPDVGDVTDAQTAANRETAITQARLNQVNEITPFGSATWSPTGQTIDGIDQYQRTVTLSPEQQALYDQQTALNQQIMGYAGPQLDRINDIISQPIDMSTLPDAPVVNDATRQRVEDAVYQRAKMQLDPTYNDALDNQRTFLANQGFDVNSDAYKDAMRDYELNRANAYNDAAFRAIEQGGAEQSRLFGLESSARERALQELAFQRGQPINELATLMGFGGGVNVPQFGAIPQTAVSGTDIIGPTYSSYQGNYNQWAQQQQNNNSLFGSIAGLAGTALGGWAGAGFPALFSDPDLKENRKKVDMADVLSQIDELPIETYNYKGGSGERHIGPMADKMEEVFPGSTTEVMGHRALNPDVFGIPMAAVKALNQRLNEIEARMS